MKQFVWLLCLVGSLSLVAQPVMKYSVDVRSNLDTIYVSLEPEEGLTGENDVFQFAATAPGTYQTMNIGRYVSDFKAFDKKGKELEVKRQSINQFKISKPELISKVTYSVAETFDTRVDELPIYLMCGSSLEKDHALLNTHVFLGYFNGLQSSPIALTIAGRQGWDVGTALKFENGVFYANSFDHAVDSPILMGKLTYADTSLSDTPIRIFTYSANDKITSTMLLKNMMDMLGAAQKFLIKLPVDQYTFLYHFEPNPPGTTGAWEHSYSSEYVMAEKDPNGAFMSAVTDIASHEFFHIVTPLNIHSEVVEKFNFVSPTPSLHLWLYEGVTEWASNMLLMRGGVISVQDYLDNSINFKIKVDEKHFDKTWSLKKIAEESFTTGAKQYANIYYRGSLVAGLLDIRLLELSEGKYGLRELILDLVDKYGKGNPVSEETFIDEVVKMTYPEIRDFFDSYVLDNQPLPHKTYLAKVGVSFREPRKKGLIITPMEDMTKDQAKMYKAWTTNMTRR
ncbi:peptidase [Marinoscillum sp. MHG1-6]|uniref:M61 family metallopeptidase n=1 Tax=Marinoscillum sp. MHG1-6 TaxID=2959627 RepID=UPI0021572922|nr:peptidase [Marinoscillum sp. MHG1-6]